jgi:hypothetical protein
MPDEGKSFWDDPVEFCRELYDEFEKHNKANRGKVIENRKFFEGEDDLLKKRAENAKVVRSHLFVQELRPAIETFISFIMDAVLQQKSPVKFSILRGSDDDQDHVLNREEILNEELREAGVTTLLFQENLNGAALMPVVATKVGWEDKEGWVYRKTTIPERIKGMWRYMLRMQENPTPAVTKTWGVMRSGPYAEVLDYDEFLYDPTVDCLDNSRAVFHRKWVTWNQFKSIAIENNYDDTHFEAIQEGLAASKEDGDKSVVEEVAMDLDELERGYKDNKILLCECYIPVHNQAGNEEVRVLVLAAGKYRLSRSEYGERSDWDKFKFPFVTMAFNKQFNRMEGTPPIEIGKPLQRAYSDNINAYLDYMAYCMFPVLKRAPGTKLSKKPVFGPGRVWDVTNPEGLEVLHVPAGDLSTVIPFAEMMAAKIRQNVNTPDISEGLAGQPSESKVKTRMRAQGTTVRNRVPSKAAGDWLINIAQKFIYMHQMMRAEEWMINVNIDVPSLTGASSPEEEQAQKVMILDKAIENPLYQTAPDGFNKLRNLTEMMYQSFRIRDIDSILPSAIGLDIVNPLGGEIVKMEEQLKTEETPEKTEDGKIIPVGGQSEESRNVL